MQPHKTKILHLRERRLQGWTFDLATHTYLALLLRRQCSRLNGHLPVINTLTEDRVWEVKGDDIQMPF